MKILLATEWAGSWPYLPEMKEEFEKRGCHVDVFDIGFSGPPPFWVRLAHRLPTLRPRLELAVLKARLRRMATNYDGVDIHFAAPIYAELTGALRTRGKRLVTSIWGSDFLRATPERLAILGRTLGASDIITTNNPILRDRLAKRYPTEAHKLKIVPFGLRSLDVLDEILATETLESIREGLLIPPGKRVVAIGYNAIPEQQHRLIVEGIAVLSDQAKAKLFVLAPMTYPDNPAYQKEIRDALVASGVEFRVLTGMMDIKDICRVRIASDIAINMQTTDALSASIQEHMYVGSAMIVGDWLPYDLFESMQVPLTRASNAKDLTEALEGTCRNAADRQLRPEHAQRIYAYSSWSSTITQWMDLYR